MALAEIAEADASGRVAEFYERLREESGSAVVNYVWRHLATIDGAAEWAWEVARSSDPGPAAGRLADRADRVAAAIATQWPARPVLDEVARRIVASYNRNNAENAVRIARVLSALQRPERQLAAVPPPAGARRDTGLPGIPARSGMTKTALAALTTLGAAGPAAASGVPPSLWRHLSVSEGLVEALAGPVAAILEAPDFQAGWSELRDMTLAEAAPHGPPVPPDMDRAAVLDGLTRFHGRIVEMTLIGRVLVAGVPNGRR